MRKVSPPGQGRRFRPDGSGANLPWVIEHFKNMAPESFRHTFLRPASTRFAHGLMMFDHEGSGCEGQKVEVLKKQVAEQVSLRRCTDPSFRRFLSALRDWFPLE